MGARMGDGFVPSVAAAAAWLVATAPAMIGACASSSSARAARSRREPAEAMIEALLGIVILVGAAGSPTPRSACRETTRARRRPTRKRSSSAWSPATGTASTRIR